MIPTRKKVRNNLTEGQGKLENVRKKLGKSIGIRYLKFGRHPAHINSDNIKLVIHYWYSLLSLFNDI